MFTSHYDKFSPENTHKILSESATFCKRYDKNILVCFSLSSSHCRSLAKCES